MSLDSAPTSWNRADEYPLANIPATPLWSENYAFTCFDSQQDVSMVALLGRWWGDPQLWRELLLISLGGDHVVCVRNYGRAATANVASAALFAVTIVEAGCSLRLSYEGPASEHSRNELMSQGVLGRPLRPLRLQLDFTAVSPIWVMSRDGTGHAAGGEAIAGALHIEQVGSGRGFIEFAGQRHAVEGAFMNRDHSRGVRDLTLFRRHCWAQGWFPEQQISFSVYAIQIFGHEGLAMAKATVSQGDRRYPAEIVDVELLESAALVMQSYRITLRSALGEMQIVNTRTSCCLPIGVTNPWEAHAGTTPGQHCMMTLEEPVHWVWEGRQGIGWSERAFNHGPFSAPFPGVIPARS